MSLTFADLIRLRTRNELRDALLGELATRGFPITSWSLGGVARTLVEGVAQGTADLWLGISAVARGMLLDQAEGDWLTELARSHYQVERIQATFARHTVRMSFTAGGPGSISPGQLLVAAASGITFRSINTSTETIPAAGGGELGIVVQCERVGLAGNTAPSILITPAAAGLSMTWQALTESAVDAETDASLRTRCRARWATLGRGATADAYVYLATSCPDASGVTRAKFVPGPGDGTLTIYLASSSGTASPTEVSAVQDWIDARCPITDAPSILAATEVPVAVTMTVVTGDTSESNRTRVTDALGALQRRLGLGDRVDVGALYHAAYHALDVRDVTLTTSPATDVVVPASGIAILSWTVALVAP